MAYERQYKVTSSLQGAYTLYTEEYGKIDRKLYLAICYDILKTIAHMIITQSLEYRIPERLGFLRVKKTKTKLRLNEEGKIDIRYNIIDWEATWKCWQEMYPGKTRKEIKNIENKSVIFQDNYHTNGDVMSWYWDRSFCNVKNNRIYSFSPSKGGKYGDYYYGRLGLAAWIKSDEKNNDYYY